MKSLEHYIDLASENGAPRSGIILGLRMAMLGLKQLAIDDLEQSPRSLIAIVETDRCLPDAVELVTGCRLGNRRLKFWDLGKMAATFIFLKSDRAVRVAAKEISAPEVYPSPEVRDEALASAYRTRSDHELFAWEFWRITFQPEELPGYRAPRVLCAACGEGIAFERQIVREDRILCRTCTVDGYFQTCRTDALLLPARHLELTYEVPNTLKQHDRACPEQFRGVRVIDKYAFSFATSLKAASFRGGIFKASKGASKNRGRVLQQSRVQFSPSFSYILLLVDACRRLLLRLVHDSDVFVRVHSATCQSEVRFHAVIAFAIFAVFGPRSASYTTSSCVITNVITPEDRYSTGYAMKATPLVAVSEILLPLRSPDNRRK